MAELVGQQTDLKTSVGRDIYKTDTGEFVSEKSVTFKLGDMFVNAPSIHKGKRYTEDEVRQMVLDGRVKPTSMHETVEEAEKAAEERSDSLLQSEVGYKEKQPILKQQTSDLFGDNPELKYSTPEEIKENVGRNTTDADLKQIAVVGSELLVPGVSEAKDVIEIKNSIEKDDTLGVGIALSSLLIGAVPLVGGVARKAFKTATNKLKLKDVKNNKEKITDEIEESKEYINAKFVDKDKIPIKTIKGYKLFRQKDGELYPLFVDSKSPVPINRWLKATDSYNFTDLKGIKRTPAKTGDAQPIANQATVDEMKKLNIEPTVTKKALEQSEFGTVQSVKYRPGWHGDTKPMATHLKKGGDRVWAEVEFSDDIDYQTIANQGASKLKSGKIDSKTADLDYIPEGGSYRYKTNPNMEGSWLISGEMKVNKVLSTDEVKNINKTKNFNKGGTVMQEQMKLFQEGGLEQDGGTVDPVSGNEVPVGSAQEEVRDDIDARLSEGEFVFPADVVRYIGLEKLMQLRQEAKAGLARMEEMGQMGNSDEATLPDDIPFSPEDITATDDAGNEGDLEMQTGGFVPTPYGTQPHQGSGVYSQPSQMGSQFNINPNYQFQPPVAYPMVMPQPQPQPQTGYVPSFVGQQPMQQPHTGFNQLIPMPNQQYENIRFVNAAGEVMIIPHVDGKPVFPVPEGYSREDGKPVDETPKDDVGETETSVPTATVTKPKEDTDRMFVDGKWMTKEQRIKAEDEKNMNRSYDMIVEQMRQKYPDISNEEILKKIKAGEGTVNVFGKEFKAPGMLFTEDKINEALNRYDAGVGPFEDTAMPTLIRTEDGTLKTDDAGKIIQNEDLKDASGPKVVQTSTAEGDAGESEARALELERVRKAEAAKRETDMIANRERIAAEQAAKEAAQSDRQRIAAEAARDAREAERQAQRDKAQAEREARTDKQKVEVAKSKREGGQGYVRAKGGIIEKPKPKKKIMKRGGLASKK